MIEIALCRNYTPEAIRNLPGILRPGARAMFKVLCTSSSVGRSVADGFR